MRHFLQLELLPCVSNVCYFFELLLIIPQIKL